jgi:hypothetical protein
MSKKLHTIKIYSMLQMSSLPVQSNNGPNIKRNFTPITSELHHSKLHEYLSHKQSGF